MKEQHEFSNDVHTPIVYIDPPDIPEEDLDDIVRRAFADVGKKHTQIKKDYFKELDKMLLDAAQSYDKL